MEEEQKELKINLIKQTKYLRQREIEWKAEIEVGVLVGVCTHTVLCSHRPTILCMHTLTYIECWYICCSLQKITTTFKPTLLSLETEHEELQRKVVSSKEVIHQKEQEIIELKVLDKV